MIPIIFKNLSRKEFIYFIPDKAVERSMNNIVHIHKKQDNFNNNLDKIQVSQ